MCCTFPEGLAWIYDLLCICVIPCWLQVYDRTPAYSIVNYKTLVWLKVQACKQCYFKKLAIQWYLQSRGVTHFKVPLSWAQLLPTGLPSQPQQAVVTCYQTLLKQLQEEGLQPLVVLHGSTVPEVLRSRNVGWESKELVEMFQQYAEFCLESLESWQRPEWAWSNSIYELGVSSLDELGNAEHLKVLHTPVSSDTTTNCFQGEVGDQYFIALCAELG